MNQERKIFICSTVYQLIVAIQLKTSMFHDEKADILITDEIKDSEVICQKLQETHLFKFCAVVHGKDTALEKGKLLYVPWVFKNLFLKRIDLDKTFFLDLNRYDEILFANIGGLNYRIATLISRKNSKAKLAMFEEGVSSYSKIFGNIFMAERSIRDTFIFTTLHKVKEYYFFDISLPVWSSSVKFIQIPSIMNNTDLLRGVLNKIFSYSLLKDSYEEQVIFFEESYYSDGLDVGDVRLVNKLAQRYGKDNIFIKTHPRNPTNRFQELGYKTSTDVTIPWEIIALNLDLNKRVLVSMTSSAIVNSYLLLHIPARLILCYEEMPATNLRVNFTIEVIEKIKQLYPNAFENKL